VTQREVPVLRFVDLQPLPTHADLLTDFYRTLYVAEFPDANERESLANMQRYLADDGAFGNAYLVTLVYDGKDVVAACVADYFRSSQCGAIEFLVVSSARRRDGLGTRLARHIEDRMRAAAAARGQTLALVMAEVNDPYKRSNTPDNVDTFERLRFWHGLGYRRLPFPYVQPALSDAQGPVRNLLLTALPADATYARTVEARVVDRFLRDYLTYAMRFDDPETTAEFVAMVTFLTRTPALELQSLLEYLGEDPARPMDVHELATPDDPDREPLLQLYDRAFPETALRVDPDRFVALLQNGAGPGTQYHLWSIRGHAGDAISGIASFFGLPHAGFGGYVAFEPPLKGTHRLRLLIARIERRLIGDSESTRGWFVECAKSDAVAALSACGFYEVALTYRAPAPRDAQPIRLLYKEYGATFEPPTLSRDTFVAVIGEIARFVYGTADEANVTAVVRDAAALSSDAIPFEPVT
jgi:GNAT superfamily N-acetyltransferase